MLSAFVYFYVSFYRPSTWLVKSMGQSSPSSQYWWPAKQKHCIGKCFGCLPSGWRASPLATSRPISRRRWWMLRVTSSRASLFQDAGFISVNRFLGKFLVKLKCWNISMLKYSYLFFRYGAQHYLKRAYTANLAYRRWLVWCMNIANLPSLDILD